MTRLANTLEAILYLKARPLTLAELAELAGCDRDATEEGLIELMGDYAHRDSALEIRETENRYCLQLKPPFKPLVEELIPLEIGLGALRTLAAIALSGTISQTDLVDLRGSGAYQHVPELIDQGLVRKRRQSDGRSFWLHVTEKFYQRFEIDKLPQITVPKKGRNPQETENPEVEQTAAEADTGTDTDITDAGITGADITTENSREENTAPVDTSPTDTGSADTVPTDTSPADTTVSTDTVSTDKTPDTAPEENTSPKDTASDTVPTDTTDAASTDTIVSTDTDPTGTAPTSQTISPTEDETDQADSTLLPIDEGHDSTTTPPDKPLAVSPQPMPHPAESSAPHSSESLDTEAHQRQGHTQDQTPVPATVTEGSPTAVL